MKAYPDVYLNDVVENQGKLFDLIAQQYPDMDTESFINTYMSSKTRKSIDEAIANLSEALALYYEDSKPDTEQSPVFITTLEVAV